MNYLAHAYLSFHQPEILLGNMISDFVKGKKKFDYPAKVQQGIELHRKIDAFTDSHPVVAEAKTVFHSDYRLYSGAFVDVTFDYFLANDKSIFADSTSLMDFSHEVYNHLQSLEHLFPDRFAGMYPYMKVDNWLYNYQFNHGMKKSYQGLVHRAAYLTQSDSALVTFNEQHYFLRDCYRRFFPSLKQFTLEQLAIQ